MGRVGMGFRLKFVVTSLCIVIGLSASAIYASGGKSKPLHLAPLRPLDVLSTGSIAIHPAGSTHIYPGATTSCTVNRSAGHHLVHCRGKKQNTQVTLTGSTDVQHLAVETGTTTWVRTSTTICRISNNKAAPGILCTPSSLSSLDTLFPELSGLKQNDTLLSELSGLLQDDVFQSVLCASTGECAFDTDGTLSEVSPTQPDSDQRPTDISGGHMVRSGVKKYPVGVCEKSGGNQSFSQPSRLTACKRTHTGEKPFICSQDGCHKAFTRSSDLTRHKRIHTGDRPHVCDQCHKAFTTSCNLTDHKRIHTGVRPFVCDWDGCNKTFTTSGNLTKHTRIHTGFRPFVCDQDG
ncbi:C2H2-type zinc finger protein, partial [Sansalvadorimonas verongulae]|nr:C2H2-type zinc finger protein [Sansalvadorimonas verongulae]